MTCAFVNQCQVRVYDDASGGGGGHVGRAKCGLMQRTLTYFVRGSINVWLTSCLFCLDSAALLLQN